MLAASPPDTVGYDGSYGPENFLSDTNVSRETLDRLQAFADLLAERQKVQTLLAERRSQMARIAELEQQVQALAPMPRREAA